VLCSVVSGGGEEFVEQDICASCIISRRLRVCIASKGWEMRVRMRFIYATSALSGEPSESFIIREAGVCRYRPYKVTPEGPTIAS
jgi:hypothetical protein